MPIDIALEKRCIKCLWNMINSNCNLYRNIVNLSLNNVSTTIGENLRYFMYKYMIQEYDCYESINIIYKKIDSYMLSHFNAKVQCDAAVIRELCESEARVVICYLVAKSWKFSLHVVYKIIILCIKHMNVCIYF